MSKRYNPLINFLREGNIADAYLMCCYELMEKGKLYDTYLEYIKTSYKQYSGLISAYAHKYTQYKIFKDDSDFRNYTNYLVLNKSSTPEYKREYTLFHILDTLTSAILEDKPISHEYVRGCFYKLYQGTWSEDDEKKSEIDPLINLDPFISFLITKAFPESPLKVLYEQSI